MNNVDMSDALKKALDEYNGDFNALMKSLGINGDTLDLPQIIEEIESGLLLSNTPETSINNSGLNNFENILELDNILKSKKEMRLEKVQLRLSNTEDRIEKISDKIDRFQERLDQALADGRDKRAERLSHRIAKLNTKIEALNDRFERLTEREDVLKDLVSNESDDDVPNDLPVALNKSASLLEDGSVLINLFDNSNTANTPTLSNVSHGAIVDHGDGTVTYTPNANFNGADSFTYTVSDGKGGTSTATVSLTVTSVNDAPTSLAFVGSTTVAEDLSVGTVLGTVSASDVDGDNLAFSLEGPNSDKFEIIGNEVRLKSALDFETDTVHDLQLVVRDGQGGIVSQALSINVTDVNEVVVEPDASITELLAQTDRAVGADNPYIAYGLSGVSDWSTQLPFLDHMKTARPFQGALKDPESSWRTLETFTNDELKDMGVFDENGMPTYMPEGIDEFSTIWHYKGGEGFEEMVGTYIIRYEGEGTIKVGGDINIISEKPGEIIFENRNGGFNNLKITETDPDGTGNYIHDIIMVKEEHLELFEAGAVFNPEFVDLLSDAREFRFMDWMKTNNSTQSEWADRPTTNHITIHDGGIAVEDMVRLANEAGVDAWFTIPHMATDEYIREFATYVRDNLDPALKASFEYSNEAWNWAFRQTMEILNEHKDLVGGQVGRAYVIESTKMANILDEVYDGSGKEDQLVKVIAGQAANTWLTEQVLFNTKPWEAVDPENAKPVSETFDAFAITTYFGTSTVSDENLRNELLDVLKNPDIDPFEYLKDKLMDPDYRQSITNLKPVWEKQAELAAEQGLKLVAYEGGQHVHHAFNINAPEEDIAALQDFLTAFVRSEQMVELYAELDLIWQEIGEGPSMQFGSVGVSSKWGSWAIYNDLNDTNPRSEFLEELNRTGDVTWEDRGGEHFQQGVIKHGDETDEVLIGTNQEDYLIGRDGDDILVGGKGDDGLHGGDGDDIAILSGSANDYTIAREGEGYRIDGLDGSDYLIDVERLQFENGQIVAIEDLLNGVTPVNTAPIAVDDSEDVAEDGSVVINLLTNDSDADGDALTIASLGAVANGTLVDNNDGTVTYTPNANFNGADSFTYTISDGKGSSATANVSIAISSVNDAPTSLAFVGSTSVAENLSVGSVLGTVSASDVDGDNLAFSLEGPNSDKFEIIGNEVRLKSALDFETDTVHDLQLVVRDGQGGIVSQALSINVTDVNEVVIDPDASITELLSQTDYAVGADNPYVAYGVNANSVFLDYMKVSRPLVAISIDPDRSWVKTGELSNQELQDLDIFDEHGWPTEIPEGSDYFSTLWSHASGHQSDDAIGTYRLKYDGEGKIGLSILDNGLNIISEEPGEIIFESTNGRLMYMSISETDPDGTGDYIRNISLVKEEHVEMFDAGAVFNPAYMDLVVDSREFRFMDFMGTNNSTQSEWADRPQINDITFSGQGMPVEVMVQMANEAGVDAWFNIPHLATDEYIREFATYVRDNLDPALKASFEYSNEAWNWAFKHTNEILNKHKDLIGGQVGRAYVIEATKMANILDEVYDGSGKEDQLVKVIAGQAANTWLTEQVLFNTKPWEAVDPENAKPVSETFDAFAITTYFGTSTVSDENLRNELLDVLKNPDIDPFEYLKDKLMDPDYKSSLPQMRANLERQAELATQQGLKLIAYEGGQHVHHAFNVNAPEEDIAALQDFLTAFVRSEQMADLYEEVAVIWSDVGGGPNMQFGVITPPSKWGSWGIYSSLTDSTPRSEVIEELNYTGDVTWEDRGGEHFQQGVIKHGDETDEVLIGTNQEDYLIGRDGDDILVGGKGDDGLHGGDGDDIAIFSGSANDYTIAREGEGYRIDGLDGSDYLIDVERLQFENGQIVAIEDLLNGVTPVNTAPIAVDDTDDVAEDGSVVINLLGNDSDADGDALTIASLGAVAHGTLVDNGDGTVTYTPNANFNGPDSFTYTVDDGQGGSATASVSVAVSSVNDVPTALAFVGSTSVAEDISVGSVIGTISASDVDGDTLSFALSGASADLFEIVGDQVRVAKPLDFETATSHDLQLSVTDGNGGTSNQPLSITVTDVNEGGDPVDPAEAIQANDDTASVDEDSSIVIDLLSNDSAPNGDGIAISIIGKANYGSITDNFDGTVTYTPNVNYSGIDTFDYQIIDSNNNISNATVTIDVSNINDVPVVKNWGGIVSAEGNAIYNLLGYATDNDSDELKIINISAASKGSYTLSDYNQLVYTKNEGATGIEELIYTVTDPSGATATGTIRIDLSNENNAPIVQNEDMIIVDGQEQKRTGFEDQAMILNNVIANDTDPDGDAIFIGNFLYSKQGELIDNGDGSLTFIPEKEFSGEAILVYSITDGINNTTTVTRVDIVSVNDTPDLTQDFYVMTENQVLTLNPLANDSDIDSDSISVTNVEGNLNGDIIINADSTITYAPNTDYFGPETLTYTVTDSDGGIATESIQIFINEAGVTPPIIGYDDYFEEVLAGHANRLDILKNDINTDSIARVEVDTNIDNVNITVNPDNSISFVSVNPNDSGLRNFSYTLYDQAGKSTTQTVNVQLVQSKYVDGFAAGDYYTLQTDSNGWSIVEKGENHRKIYISNSDDALTRQGLANREGLDVSEITDNWIKSNMNRLASVESEAVNEDIGNLIMQYISWQGVPNSNWIMVEKGYQYDNINFQLSRLNGESALNPMLITSYGQGERPIINNAVSATRENTGNNIVIKDMEFHSGMTILKDKENLLLEGITTQNKHISVQDGIENLTIRRSEIIDAHQDEHRNDSGWHAHIDRVSGIYANGVDGLLFEGNFVDRNGWAEGYTLESDSPAHAPSIYNQNIYFSYNNRDVTVVDNIISRASSFGLQLRAGGVIEDNIFIDNNIAFLTNSEDGALSVNVSDPDSRQYGNNSFWEGNVITDPSFKLYYGNNGGRGIGVYSSNDGVLSLNNISINAENDVDTLDARGFTERDKLFEGSTFYEYNINSDTDNVNNEDFVTDLDLISIENYTKNLLGDSATVNDLFELLRTRGQENWTEIPGADEIANYFKSAFDIDVSQRLVAQDITFVPRAYTGGTRWDNSHNWTSGDVAGSVAGDNVNLNGNWVNYAGTYYLNDLDLGSNGELSVNHGYLMINGALMSGEAGGRILIDNSGQFWTNGYADADMLSITSTGGRFGNVGVFDGAFNMNITDNAQIIFATNDAEMIVDGDDKITISGSDAKVGFDGDNGGDAVLSLDGGTLAFDLDKASTVMIREFKSGHFGDAPDVNSVVDLGQANSSLEIDMQDLALADGIHSFNLIGNIDQLQGDIGHINITGSNTDVLGVRLSFNRATDEVNLDVSINDESLIGTHVDLYGSDNMDVFYLSGDSGIDEITIHDFDAANGDVLDITDLLEGYDDLSDSLTDFVQITSDGTNSTILIDADGGADNFVKFATFNGAIGLDDIEILEQSGSLQTII